MKSRLPPLCFAIFGLSLAACAEPTAQYGSLTLTALNNPPGTVTLVEDQIGLSEGSAVYVSANLESSTEKNYNGSTDLELRSSDPTIFDVYTADNDSFVIVANAEGTSCMEVVIEGSVEDCIDVVVDERAF